ncbi:hypothetical protein ACVILK_005425 [Bradyrhizobium embrapense]
MINKIRALMKVNPEPRFELFTVAHEHDLAVVDDVYLDWRGLAEAAKHLPFEPALGSYPGLRVTLRIHTPAIEGLIAGMLASDHLLGAQESSVFSLLGSLATFDDEQHVPHRDADVEISGVIYLCDGEGKSEGTGFYKHRPSGLSGGFIGDPELAEAARASPFNTIDEFLFDLSSSGPGRSIYGPAPSLTWELTHAVELRPNRLVLFDSRLFHAALSPRRRTTRLTQNLFLRTQPAKVPVRFREFP